MHAHMRKCGVEWSWCVCNGGAVGLSLWCWVGACTKAGNGIRWFEVGGCAGAWLSEPRLCRLPYRAYAWPMWVRRVGVLQGRSTSPWAARTPGPCGWLRRSVRRRLPRRHASHHGLAVRCHPAAEGTWVLLGAAGCCWVRCWVLLGAAGCCWVLLGAAGCCWVLLGALLGAAGCAAGCAARCC
jgi:hypothetical protein